MDLDTVLIVAYCNYYVYLYECINRHCTKRYLYPVIFRDTQEEWYLPYWVISCFYTSCQKFRCETQSSKHSVMSSECSNFLRQIPEQNNKPYTSYEWHCLFFWTVHDYKISELTDRLKYLLKPNKIKINVIMHQSLSSQLKCLTRKHRFLTL